MVISADEMIALINMFLPCSGYRGHAEFTNNELCIFYYYLTCIGRYIVASAINGAAVIINATLKKMTFFIF